jgi:phosphonate transport system substrate-binding protein
MKRRTVLECMAGWVGLTVGRPGLAAPVAESLRLRIGLTAVILADQVAFLTRWGKYLSARTECPVSFVARESYQGILDLLFSGQLEAAWICGYPYVQNKARLQLLPLPLYQGKPHYQAYLIRPKGATDGIQGWADLKGRVLAYSDPLSNSGWLVPQAQLRLVGLAPPDLRRGFFAHGHRNVAEAVAARLAQAGCIDGYVWETMRRQKMAAVDQTEVIWKSAEYGFPPLVARHGAPSEITDRLRTALLGMNANAEGRALLDSLNLDGFRDELSQVFDSIAALAAAQSRVG